MDLPIRIANRLSTLSHQLAETEAEPSRSGMPAGSAQGGTVFELQMRHIWTELMMSILDEPHMSAIEVRCGEKIMFGARDEKYNRRLCLDIEPSDGMNFNIVGSDVIPYSWGQTSFDISDIVCGHLGSRVYEFAPPTIRDSADYYQHNYPRMYQGKKTKFDFVVVCYHEGKLIEKMLFEYKAAKSSKGATVDGNAHERLSFQMLQYLEIAELQAKTSLNVVASSAFARYKNKYHVAFNQQAIRLGGAFTTFCMRFAACETEYYQLFSIIPRFLLLGEAPPRDYRALPRR